MNATSQTLKSLFLAHSRPILLTYGLTSLENLFELLYPLVTGNAIDGLLKGQYISLIPLFSVWLAHTLTGVARQVYDTLTFTRIYSNLATSVVLEQNRQRVPASQIIARSALSREFVDFFERDIPSMITAIFGFVGAIVMLFVYDVQIGLYCLLLLLPLLVINRLYALKSRYLNQELNNQLEQEAEILIDCQPELVQTHYQQLAQWRTRLSNAEAINWGVMELFLIALAVAVLIRTIALPGIQAGEIYAIISYLWKYLSSLDQVPFLVQQFTRLQDIGTRMS